MATLQKQGELSRSRDYIIVKRGTNIRLSPKTFTDIRPTDNQKRVKSTDNYEAAVAEAGKLGGVVTSLSAIIKKYGEAVAK